MLPSPHRTLRPLAVFLCATLLASLVGCAGDDADAAIDQASEDLGCDRSQIEVLDSEHSTDPTEPERFRLFACGQEVVYVCTIRRTSQHPRRGCARDSYRFP